MKEPKGEKFYKLLLKLYPNEYRREYAQEMRLLFREMYHDQLRQQGRVDLKFWLRIISDLTVSLFECYLENLGSLRLNSLNIIGLLLLLPFGTIAMLDAFSRLAQLDFSHPNYQFFNAVSHTVLYQPLILRLWVLIFPTLAVMLNLASIVLITSRGRIRVNSLQFLRVNIVSVLVFAAGLICIGIVYGHDMVPCIGHNVLRQGIGNLPGIVKYCRLHA